MRITSAICYFVLLTSLLYGDPKSDTALQEAARWGDLSGVKRALRDGADINAEGHLDDFKEISFKKNALIWASVMGHLRVVKFLVESGAHLEDRDQYDQTALFAAAKRGHADVVKYLLAQGANPKVTVFSSNAITYGIFFPEIVEMLAKAGTDVDQMSEFQQTPLMGAATGGHVESLRILLKYGAKMDLQFPDKNKGRTALMQSAEASQLETAEELLKHGANATLKDNEGQTAEDLATKKGESRMIALFANYKKK